MRKIEIAGLETLTADEQVRTNGGGTNPTTTVMGPCGILSVRGYTGAACCLPVSEDVDLLH
jgi:hypothetical protein